MRRIQLLLIALLPLAFSPSATAGLVYGFADASGNPSGTFNVLTGSSIEIQVYLVGVGRDAGRLDVVGLYTAGVGVSFSPGAGFSGGAFLTAITPGPAFLPPPPEPVIDNVAGVGSISLLADPGAPAMGIGGSILLASFVFKATSEGTIDLLAFDEPGLDTFLWGDLSETFDVETQTSATLRVTPAPPTLLLGLLGGLASLSLRLRVRRTGANGAAGGYCPSRRFILVTRNSL